MSSKKQTAMRQLLNQLREERNTLTMDAEWNRCFQAIEMIIQTKFLPLEKEQMDKVSEDWWVEGCSHMKDKKRIYESFEQYYTSTYD